MQWAVELFISLWEECEQRLNKGSSRATDIVIKPIRSSGMNSRGQIDLIDLQSQPHGSYKWILNYQVHLAKFLYLQPLERKSVVDATTTLLDIFLSTNGAPNILQSDNGQKFCEQWAYKTVAQSEAGARQTSTPTVTRQCWEIKWWSSLTAHFFDVWQQLHKLGPGPKVCTV